jgi:hypothetical protein
MSSNSEPWVVAAIVIGSVIVGRIIIAMIVAIWTKSAYKAIKKNTPFLCDIDAFVGPGNPVVAKKFVFTSKILIGSRQPSLQQIPIEFYKNPHYEDLLVSCKKGAAADCVC